MNYSDIKKVHDALIKYWRFFDNTVVDKFNIIFHQQHGWKPKKMTIHFKSVFDLNIIGDEFLTAITHEDGTELITWLKQDIDRHCRIVDDAIANWIRPLCSNPDIHPIYELPKANDRVHCIWLSDPYGPSYNGFLKKLSLDKFDYKNYRENAAKVEGGLSLPMDKPIDIIQPSEEVRMILEKYVIGYKIIKCSAKVQYNMMEVLYRDEKWITSNNEIS